MAIDSTYGVLNLTHRDSSGDPSPLVPHRQNQVRVKLNDIAQHFTAGHRLRLSLSTSYWPLAWLPPEPFLPTSWGGEKTGHI